MRTELWLIGKTAFPYLHEGMGIYEKRLGHYLSYQTVIFPDIKNAKNLSVDLLKQKEGEAILAKLRSDDHLIILDEKGKQFSSVEFAAFLEQKFQMSYKRVVFLVGGAFGFSEEIYKRADYKMALSKMTFSHQMVRVFFLEQLYRAMTIVRGEPYHNE